MNTQWNYMNRKLDPSELPTMRELLVEIDENGGTDAALAKVREEQYHKYGCELMWRYPISQGDSAGGFFMPVQEGILWIPYDEMEQEAGEILNTNDAVLMDEDACAVYRDDFLNYSRELCEAFTQCAAICRSIGHTRNRDTVVYLGTFDMVSDRMAVSDPCYDADVWCRGELENVLPGIWRASVIKREIHDWGQRVMRLVAIHEDYADSDVAATEIAGFEVGVDSGQAGLFDVLHYRDDSVVGCPGTADGRETNGGAWYMACCRHTLTNTAAGVLPYGVVSSSGFGDGSYDCFYGKNSDGKIVRVEIEFIPEEG